MKNQKENVVSKESTSAQRQPSITSQIHYDPSNLLDALIVHLGLKNDAALARTLEIASSMVSKIRNHGLPVSGAMLIRMHEVSELTIGELRILMGDHGRKFRISNRIPKQKNDGSTLLY